MRLRLEEKESLLSKKSQQISELTEEKSTQQGEITDLKDMLDVKERKVNVLQKKVRNVKTRFGKVFVFITNKPVSSLHKR